MHLRRNFEYFRVAAFIITALGLCISILIAKERAGAEEDDYEQFDLGTMQLQDEEVPQNYEEAAKRFLKAAKNGIPTAQANLGVMYLQGKGVPQNYEEAEKWLRKAAKKGISTAQTNLGILYFQGKGVRQSYKEAEKWLHKAAENGDIVAQYMLGTIYAKGLGVAKDYIQAYMWLASSIAGSTGRQGQLLQKATDLRDSFVDKMTPRQINEAEQLVKEFELTACVIMRNEFYRDKKEFSMPVVLHNPMPSYTDKARNAHASGIVVTRCFIRKDGTVDNCEIIRELGYGLDESVINTLENKWRFKPAAYKGRPIDIKTDIETSFHIY